MWWCAFPLRLHEVVQDKTIVDQVGETFLQEVCIFIFLNTKGEAVLDQALFLNSVCALFWIAGFASCPCVYTYHSFI
jgi:hypothetical protein